MPKSLNFNVAAPFKRYHELEGQFAEYNIEYRSDDSRLDDLIDFISLPFIKRVNVHFDNKVMIKDMGVANRVKECIYVRLSADQWFATKSLKEAGIPFFFDATLPVSTYCQLDEMINLGVSDVYIADDLTYNLQEVSDYCHTHNVNMRLVLNRIPLTTFDKGKSVKSPIYRPQDTDVLSHYFDVFEFDCGDPYDWNKFDVYVKAYCLNCQWHGNLAELNQDIMLEGGFPNDSLIPNYTDYKMNCERVCNVNINNHCRKCEQFFEIGKEFKDKGAVFRYETI